MSDVTNTMADAPKRGPVLAADGTPLKKSLNRALRMQKLRALMLIAPLLIFVLVTFIAPIFDMLFRSVENQIVSETMPRTVAELRDWDESGDELPGQEVYEAAYYDLFIAAERKLHTRLGTRLNYELTGVSSMFRKSGRGLEDIGEVYQDQFEDLDDFWKDGENWSELMGSDSWLAAAKAWDDKSDAPQPRFELRDDIASVLPRTSEAYQTFAHFVQVEEEDELYTEDPWSMIYLTLHADLTNGASVSSYSGPGADVLAAAANAAPGFETVDFKESFLEIDKDWGNIDVWRTIKLYSPNYTTGYFLNAVDLEKSYDGIEARPENEQIYLMLFGRTLFMSLVITFSCILLGYPVAWILANLPARTANLLMILVLLPFWTSLLVRTYAKALLKYTGEDIVYESAKPGTRWPLNSFQGAMTTR